MSIYAEQIENAETLEELENIIEEAADNMNITTEDYCAVYNYCLNRVRSL